MAARRRFSERLLLVANVTVANAVAALWIASFLQPRAIGVEPGTLAIDERQVVVPLQTVPAWLALLLAVGLLMWNFAFLVRRRPGGTPDHWIVSESPSGPVRVATEAIEAGLRSAGEGATAVTRLRVQLRRPTPKRLLIAAQFTCADGQDHLALSQRLREALVARFAQLVRLSDGARAEFELEFQGFAGKVAKDAAAPLPATPEEPEPFRGPQYPIEDEDERKR